MSLRCACWSPKSCLSQPGLTRPSVGTPSHHHQALQARLSHLQFINTQLVKSVSRLDKPHATLTSDGITPCWMHLVTMYKHVGAGPRCLQLILLLLQCVLLWWLWVGARPRLSQQSFCLWSLRLCQHMFFPCRRHPAYGLASPACGTRVTTPSAAWHAAGSRNVGPPFC